MARRVQVYNIGCQFQKKLKVWVAIPYGIQTQQDFLVRYIVIRLFDYLGRITRIRITETDGTTVKSENRAKA